MDERGGIGEGGGRRWNREGWMKGSHYLGSLGLGG